MKRANTSMYPRRSQKCSFYELRKQVKQMSLNVTNTSTNLFLTLWQLHCACCQGAAAMPKVPISARGIVRDLEDKAVHARMVLQLHVVWYVEMELIIWNLKAMNVRLRSAFIHPFIHPFMRSISTFSHDVRESHSLHSRIAKNSLELWAFWAGPPDCILCFGGQTAYLIEANEAEEEQRRSIDDASTANKAKAARAVHEGMDALSHFVFSSWSCLLLRLECMQLSDLNSRTVNQHQHTTVHKLFDPSNFFKHKLAVLIIAV